MKILRPSSFNPLKCNTKSDDPLYNLDAAEADNIQLRERDTKETERAMKKWVGFLIVLSLATSVHAGLDISFSSNNGGNWSYTAETEGIGTFSFEVASVNTLPDVDTPITLNDSVFIPDIKVSLDLESISGTLIYMGTIDLPLTPIEIKKGQGKGGNTALTANLNTGTVVVVGTTASFYPVLGDDTGANWHGWAGPEFMDFSLTLQGDVNIAEMILHNNNDSPIVGGTFSGSIIVPEPATFFILALGSVLLLKKE